MTYDGVWYPMEGGRTIGRRGPADGRVLADEELGEPDDPEDADARLTIERLDAGGFCVTAQLYGGWLYQSLLRPDEAQAHTTAAALRPALERLAALIPMEDDRDVTAKVEALNQAIAQVEAQFPEDARPDA